MKTGRNEKMDCKERIASTCVIAAGALLFASAAAIADCEFKLGMMGPLSGGASAWGVAMKNGTEFAAAEMNAKGGLQVGTDKCKVVVVSYDSKYSAEAAAAGANFLASQGVKVIIGPVGSPEATGVKPVAARNGQITFASVFAKDALSPQFPLAFQQLPGPVQWGPPLARAAKEKFNIKSIVIVAPNDQGGTDIASVTAEAYKAEGIAASEEYYQRGTTNFAPIVTRILNTKPEAIDTSSSPPGDAATMVKQVRQAGFTGPIGRLGGPGVQEILRVVGGPEALGSFFWYEIVAMDDPKVRALWDDYKKLMGSEATQNTLMATGAAAARITLKAITSAGTMTDVEKIAAAIRATPVEDPNLGKGEWTGQKQFGINQELTFPVGMGLIVNGKELGIQRIEIGKIP
jgi:branched-chain amino acid transport system substrate-binding protein